MLYPPFKKFGFECSSVSALFSLSVTLFFKPGIRVNTGKECLGIADG